MLRLWVIRMGCGDFGFGGSVVFWRGGVMVVLMVVVGSRRRWPRVVVFTGVGDN
jgi:hypothetical protein